MKALSHIFTATAACLLFVGGTASAVGMGYGQAAATGMAGAYTASATGIHAAYWNPANLAAFRFRSPGVEVGIINTGFKIGNDGIAWGDFVDWTADEVLTTEEIQKALGQLSGSSVAVHQSAEIGMPFSVAVGQYSVSFGIVQMVDLGISRGFLDMIADDPSPDFTDEQAILDRYNESKAGNVIRDLSGMKADFWALATFGVSHARLIDVDPFDRFAVGGTINYYAASPRMRIVKSSGQAVVYPNGWDTDAQLVMELAGASLKRTTDEWGDKETDFEAEGFAAWGLGFNVGVAGTWNKDLDFSVALHNIPLRKITWKTAERRTYTIQNDEPINAKAMFDDKPDGMDTIDYLDSLFAPTGGKVSQYEQLSSISAAAPAYLRAGVQKDFFARMLTLGVDIEQGFNETAITSTTPRLATGVEVRPLGGWLPLRAGMSIGGKTGHFASLGFGLHAGFFEVDMGFVKEGAFTPFEVPFSGSSTGLGMAMEMKLSF